MLKFSTEIRVRYADTDKMGVVYNGKYLEYFEVGRTELLRNFGLPYNEVEKEGYLLPLIKAGLEFKMPARYDDVILVESVVNDIYTPRVHIEYNITRKETGELLTLGFTTHVFTRVSDNKPTRPPQIYLDALKKYFDK